MVWIVTGTAAVKIRLLGLIMLATSKSEAHRSDEYVVRQQLGTRVYIFLREVLYVRFAYGLLTAPCYV